MEPRPNRLNDGPKPISPSRRTARATSSRNTATTPAAPRAYDKMEPVFLDEGAIRYGRLGDAQCILGDAVSMAEITTGYLRASVHLFDDDTPITAFRREN